MKTRILILFILISAVLLGISLFFSQDEKTMPPDRITKAASFSILIPGQTTKKEVIEIAGEPALVETLGDKTYLYYDTQNSSFKDFVVIRGGVEFYALENIFADEAPSLDSTVKSFGEHDTYYSIEGPYVWYVFLERGIALETDGQSILKILYFSPQTEDQFLNSIGKDLGISKEEPMHEVLRP